MSGTENVYHTRRKMYHTLLKCVPQPRKRGKNRGFFDPLLWYNFGTFLPFVYQSYNTILILPNAKSPYKNLARKLLNCYKSD